MLALFSGELVFGRAYYRKEFCVLQWVGLDNKNYPKHYENSLKQLQTASTVHGLHDIRESLLSEGLLHLRSGGFIFGRAYFWGSLLSKFYGIFIYKLSVHSFFKSVVFSMLVLIFYSLWCILCILKCCLIIITKGSFKVYFRFCS